MKAACIWTWDADSEGVPIWATTCGREFQFEDGGPWRNGLKFCGYCGKRLQEVHTHSKHKEDKA